MDKERFKLIKCDWKKGECSVLTSEDIKMGSYGGVNCYYRNKLNSGDSCKNACRLKDYEWEESQKVLEWRRKWENGELDLHF